MIALFIRGISEIYDEWIDKYSELKDTDIEFISDEILMSAVIGSIYGSKADEIMDNFTPMFELEDVKLFENIGKSFPVQSIANNIIPDGSLEEKALFDQLIHVLEKGENLAGYPTTLNGHAMKQKIVEGMTKSSKYYTNNYFNNRVMPEISHMIQSQINNPDLLTDTDFFQKIQKRLNKRLKSTPYWRTVNNAAASRAYTYGTIKAAQIHGMTMYTFWNPLDVRTSEICRSYTGQQFFIADAIQKIEEIADAENPDDIKTISPWLNYKKDIEGKSNADILSQYGVPTPPLHGNCRSLLIPSSSSI